MKQCHLIKGKCHQVAWIPSQFAVTGKFLRIGDENGWRVHQAYEAVAFLLTSDGRGMRSLFGSI